MSIKYFGWGRWGRCVHEKIKALGRMRHQHFPIEIMLEEEYGATHYPDPLSAEAIFLAQQAKWQHFIGGGSGYCRIHFLNMAENFSSGALSAFLKNQPAHKETIDLLVAFLPPPGSNPATAGRLFASIYGDRKFADIIIIIDGCAGIFSDCDEDDIANYAASIGALLLAFERSGCMLPLLLRMGTKLLAPAFADSRRLKADCSLERLWQALSYSHDQYASKPGHARDFLAFSISGQREANLARIFERNMPREQLIYIPFSTNYEWRDVVMPTPERLAVSNNFTGIFCALDPPQRASKFLGAYIDAYWPDEEGSDLEDPDSAIWEWLFRKGLARKDADSRYMLIESCRNVSHPLGLVRTALKQIWQNYNVCKGE